MNDIADLVKRLRAMIAPDDTELRESLKVNGWVPQLPAIADEHGVVLVGNRRMRLAKQLGIKPVIQTVVFGKGSDADVSRVRLASISNIGGAPMTVKDRKRIAEYLYTVLKWTMQAIGKALGVSKATISGDLVNCSTPEQLKPAVTETNPRGAGRPKGSGKKPAETEGTKPVETKPTEPVAKRGKPAVKLDRAVEIVRPLVDAGLPPPSREQQDAHGISHGVFDTAYRMEQARVNEAPVVDWTTAPEPVKAKIMAAIEKERAKLQATYEVRLNEEANRLAHQLLEEGQLKAWVKEAKNLAWRISSRKHVLTMKQFNRIRFTLHPDTYKHVEEDERNELCQLWQESRLLLVGEEEDPMLPKLGRLPETVEDLMKLRAKYQADRKSKRAAARQNGASATGVSAP